MCSIEWRQVVAKQSRLKYFHVWCIWNRSPCVYLRQVSYQMSVTMFVLWQITQYLHINHICHRRATILVSLLLYYPIHGLDSVSRIPVTFRDTKYRQIPISKKRNRSVRVRANYVPFTNVHCSGFGISIQVTVWLPTKDFPGIGQGRVVIDLRHLV